MSTIQVVCIGPPLVLQIVDGSIVGSSSASSSSRQQYRAQSDEESILLSLTNTDTQWTGQLRISLKTSRQLRHRRFERLACDGHISGLRAYKLLRNVDGDDRLTVLIWRIPDTTSYLGSVPDDTPLGSLSLPGSHQSCAYYGYMLSQCQQPSTPLVQQLSDGIRFLDIRLKVVNDQLLSYHGIRPERTRFTDTLSVIHAFLAAHLSETVIVSIKEETPPFHPQFASMLWRDIEPYQASWYLEERIPRLGEVRGKVVLMSRFDVGPGDKVWDARLGIHPSTWPDSRREGFEWDCAGTMVRTQDWYRVPTFLEIPEKFDSTILPLVPAVHPPEKATCTMTVSFSSASYFPLSPPAIIAKGFGWPAWHLGIDGVNIRLLRWLLECAADGQRVSACVLMDFYRQIGSGEGGGNDLAEILIQMNAM